MFFSNLVGEEGPRIQGVKDSRVCFLKILSTLLTFFRLSSGKPSPLWRWFPEESTNGTDVPLIHPPYRGRIKPPAFRVIVDFCYVFFGLCNSLAFHSNPWILDPLNPMGSHLLNWRSFTCFALINYNESWDDPNNACSSKSPNSRLRAWPVRVNTAAAIIRFTFLLIASNNT